MSNTINVVAEWQSMTDTTNVTQPNKRNIIPASSAIDEMQKMKQNAATAVRPTLNNLKDEAQFYVFKSNVIDAASVRGGLKTHENADNVDDETDANIDGESGLEEFQVVAHYGFVTNGSNITIDRSSPHFNFHVAYETVRGGGENNTIDPATLNRAGHKCKVRFHTEDTTMCQVVAWMGDPVTDYLPTVIEQWYEGGNYDPNKRISAPSRRTGSSGGDRRRRGGAGGSGGSGGDGTSGGPSGHGKGPDRPHKGPSRPGDSPPYKDTSGSNPATPVSQVTSDPSTWQPNPSLERYTWRGRIGNGIKSTFDPKTLEPQVQAMYEIYPMGEWGERHGTRKPAGLPRAAHPTLSQRSSLRIMDYYVNQLAGTEIPLRDLWWTKLIITSFYKGESGQCLGNSATNLDLRGKPDKDYLRTSYEKGDHSYFKRNYASTVVHFLEDGPRRDGTGNNRGLISAVGFHGANYNAWNYWFKSIGRTDWQHVALQSYKDEVQVSYLFYYIWAIKRWRAANPDVEMNLDIAERLSIAIKAEHAGAAFGRMVLRKTKNLSDLSELYVKKNNGVYTGGAVVMKWIEKNLQTKYARDRNHNAQLYLKKTNTRLNFLRQAYRDSEVGGRILIKLDTFCNTKKRMCRNYSQVDPKLEVVINGRRFGYLDPPSMMSS